MPSLFRVEGLLRIAWIAGAMLAAIPAFAVNTNTSVWAYPGTSGRLVHRPDYFGNRLVDSSGVGYKGGTVPLPGTNLVPVKITLSPIPGDNKTQIQNAINFVQNLPPDTNGFRGAVLLTAGEYPVSGQISIRSNGVVLRGVGSGTNGTVLRATATNQHTLIRVFGAGSASTVSGTTRNITNLYVPVGARSFEVDSTSGLNVGDRVFVRRVATTAWIHDLGMDLLCCEPDVSIWTASGYHLDMDRTITRMEGNRIFIDSPVTTAIDRRYTNGTIREYTFAGRVQNVGIEDIRGVSDFVSATDENHGWILVQFSTVENGWVRNVVSQNFGYACVSLSSSCKSITVADCQSWDPISVITGGRRYAFVLDDSQLCLVKNCYNDDDRHQFVTQSTTTGPNLFVDGISDNAKSDAGPHHRWASAAVWDNIEVNGHNLNIQNRGNSGSGHGWAGANCIVWNSDASGGFVVQNPPGARNWLIGSIGAIETGSGISNSFRDHGTYDSHGTNVFPQSLYYAQLQDRVASPNLQTREYWMGEIDAFTNSPAGELVPADAAWTNALLSIAGGQPLDRFDVVAANHFVPFTFNFTISTNDHIVGATLSIAMRATNSEAGDVLYLDATNNTFTFAALNWLPISTSTVFSNTTVRVVDLGAQTNLLTDGKLNVALQGDIGVDWAMLELHVAPKLNAGTITLLPSADATVRGGASANGNFGTDTVLTVKEDSTADNDRKAYLRWDLTGVTGTVFQARVRLTPVTVGTGGIEQGITLSTSTSWNETGITWNNQPGGGKRFATWMPGASNPVEFVVTAEVADALKKDKQLSLQIYSVRNVGASGDVSYASREHPTNSFRPQLLLSVSDVPPVISDVTNQLVAVNGTTAPIPFTIGDNETPAASLTLSGSAANTNLVPNANIVFGGSGSNRTVTITPASSQSGSTLITITVTDASGLSASDSFLLTVSSHPPGAFVWNGPGVGLNNWTISTNWTPAGPPEALDDLKFFDTGAGGVAIGQLNNYANPAFSGVVASLHYGNTNGNHTTLIANGETLTLSGANGLIAGTETDNGSSQVVDPSIRGSTATLAMTHPGADLIVRQGSAVNGTQRATLDLSNVGRFTGAFDQLLVGFSGSVPRATGTLLLARTNTLALAGSPGMGAGDNAGTGGGGNFVYLGQENTLLANSIVIGRQKGTATLTFQAGLTNPTVTFRGLDGASRVASWSIADNSLQSVSTTPSLGTNDFVGGGIDALVDVLVLGKGQTATGAGSTGVLAFGDGVINVNTLQLGFQSASGATSGGVGHLSASGSNAVLVVNTVVELGHTTGGLGTGNTFGSLTINDGTLFARAISAGAGSGPNAITLENATFVLTNTAGTPASPVSQVTLSGSTLHLNVTNNTTNMVVGTLLTAGGSNYVHIPVLPPIGAVPATFRLIDYSGTILGNGFNFALGSLPSGGIYAAYLSNNVADSSVDLVVTTALIPDAFLTWNGNVDGTWDQSTANWKNNVGPDLVFSDGDTVVFNDTAGGATNINLAETLSPASVTISNSAKTYTFVDEGKLSGTMPLTKQGNGTAIVANSGVNDYTGGTTISGGTLSIGNGGTNGNLPAAGAIVDNATLAFNRTDNFAVPNVISGSGTLEQNGSGILTLSGANTLTGKITIANGTLLAGNTNALGAAVGITAATNTGTLDVNGLNLTLEPVTLSGAGMGGRGAVVNNSGTNQTSALRQVTLAGDVYFGGTSRWDIRNTGGTATLNTFPAGSPHRIIKVGTNQVSIVGVTVIDSALGDIEIREGTFAIQTTTVQVGDPAKTITVWSNAILNVFRLTNSPLNKVLVLSNAAVVFNENDSNFFRGPTMLAPGMATFNISSSGGPGGALTLTNVVSGPGGFTKIGAGPLFLQASNTYTGNTLVSTGRLALRGIGSISGSAVITVASNATLDASTRIDGTLTLVNTQTLNGIGTVQGNLVTTNSATVAPGTSVGTLVVSGSATLRGVTSMELNKSAGTNDVLQAGTTISYGGTLILTNLSGTLALTDTFKLFNAASYNGSFTAIVPATPAPGWRWDTSQLTVNGRLGIAVAPPPVISTIFASAGNVVISGSNGPANGAYVLRSSTNLTLPLPGWTVIATNVFTSAGSFNLTNAMDPAKPHSFYLIQLQ